MNVAKYQSVSTTLVIGSVELPNRIVFPAWQVNYANTDGTVSDKLMDFYTAIADGGCGLTFTGAATVSPDSVAFDRVMRIDHDGCVPGLTKLFGKISIPVIQVWDGILAIPVIGVVDSRRLDRLMDTMLVRIRDARSKIVIIDITGSHLLDSIAASHLINIAHAAKLLGATCVITGIKPEIAQTVVRLGPDVELGCLTTRKTLQDGLRYGLKKIGYGIKIRDTT